MEDNRGLNMPKRILLVEDSLTIRKVFDLALSRSDIAITAVDNGEDAVRLAGEILPDLVIADLTLPGKNGFAVAAELRAMEKTGKIPVLILSGTLIPLDEARFKASGARGVLFKPFESRELLENIERLLRESTPTPESRKPQETPAVDERWDFSDVMDEVEAEAGKSAAPAPAGQVQAETLSERELEVLRLIALGYSNPEIAQRLHLSAGTVRNYVSAILQKLGVEDRTQAAVVAYQWGLLIGEDNDLK